MTQDSAMQKKSGVRQSFLPTNKYKPIRPDSQPALYGLGGTPAEGHMQGMQWAKTCTPSRHKRHWRGSAALTRPTHHPFCPALNRSPTKTTARPFTWRADKWVRREGEVSSLLLTNLSLDKHCLEIVVRDSSAKAAFLTSNLPLQQALKEQPHWTWHEMGFYREVSPTVLKQQELPVKFIGILSMWKP